MVTYFAPLSYSTLGAGFSFSAALTAAASITAAGAAADLQAEIDARAAAAKRAGRTTPIVPAAVLPTTSSRTPTPERPSGRHPSWEKPGGRHPGGRETIIPGGGPWIWLPGPSTPQGPVEQTVRSGCSPMPKKACRQCGGEQLYGDP